MKVTDYVATMPEDLKIGDIVCDAFIMWHFASHDYMIEWRSGKWLTDHHVSFRKYLFHHTLKGFELIDDNYNR